MIILQQTRGVLFKPAAVITGITWDPVASGAGVTLSNGNLTATSAGSGNKWARSTTSHASGKYYYEVLMQTINMPSNDPQSGFTNQSTFTGSQFGFLFGGGTPNGWGLNTNSSGGGSSFAISNAAANGPFIQINSGYVEMHAIDIGAGKYWVGINGTWLSSGNPAGGTNAMFSTVAGTVYCCAAVGGAASASQCTARFASASWTYSAPTGFVEW